MSLLPKKERSILGPLLNEFSRAEQSMEVIESFIASFTFYHVSISSDDRYIVIIKKHLPTSIFSQRCLIQELKGDNVAGDRIKTASSEYYFQAKNSGSRTSCKFPLC